MANVIIWTRNTIESGIVDIESALDAMDNGKVPYDRELYYNLLDAYSKAIATLDTWFNMDNHLYDYYKSKERTLTVTNISKLLLMVML